MITQFAGRDQRTWDEKWPEIMLAVNSSISESTGYTPSFLNQGREPRLPSALYDKETLGTGRATETPDENAQKLKEIFEIVRRNLEKASQDQARYHYGRQSMRRQWTPAVGDVAWAKEHHLSKGAEGFAARLAPRYDGPYQVVDFVSPVICKIRNVNTKKERTIHTQWTIRGNARKQPRTRQGTAEETPWTIRGNARKQQRTRQGTSEETPGNSRGNASELPRKRQ
ncbi:uncharacterized protein [Drosophila takahashii]|uniref:uncharacterized protein n=1 Tax=Drosophila takahashii TaxID=29030 RepID=UPI003898D91F